MKDNRYGTTGCAATHTGPTASILAVLPVAAFCFSPKSPDWKMYMELWTEYEGRTIDGAFPLKRLLLPEGRSAFFSTSNGKGEPTVIRLIESHFDADEILARWQAVEALGHPNLLKLETYGQLVLDGTTVIYAVMEPVDANLAEVLDRQRLTLPECRELAASLISALDVLHANGFVHEHLEPGNIFAVGDVVKLRSDCIREAPEGMDGFNAKQQDVSNLARVLLQALTQNKAREAAAAPLPLPSPFNEIVRNGMGGSWGLDEMKIALQTARRSSASAPAAVSVPAAPIVDRSNNSAARPVETTTRSTPHSALPRTMKPQSAKAEGQAVLPFAPEGFSPDDEDVRRDSIPVRGFIAAAGLFALLTLGVGWYFAHPHSGAQPNSPASLALPRNSARPASASTTAAKSPQRASQPPTHAVARPSRLESGGAQAHGQWRVVAYTFNHKEQATKRSAAVSLKHPELHPAVFTPTGHAPYLVAIGGQMGREQAEALARKARSLGLPRDTFAQNYSSKAR